MAQFLWERKTVTFLNVLDFLAEDAIRCGRPTPVIDTDIETAKLMRRMIGEEMGRPCINQPDCIVKYNGIKIRGGGVILSERSAGWLEHFGILAELENAE